MKNRNHTFFVNTIQPDGKANPTLDTVHLVFTGPQLLELVKLVAQMLLNKVLYQPDRFSITFCGAVRDEDVRLWDVLQPPIEGTLLEELRVAAKERAMLTALATETD